MEQTGKCIYVGQLRSGVSQKNGKEWASQEYVIEIPGQFQQRMVFGVFGEDRIRQFNIQLGYNYNVQFDIDAHEYQGRWYNSINAYNVACTDAVTPAPQQQHPQHSPQPQCPPHQRREDPSKSIPAGDPIPQTENADLPF